MNPKKLWNRASNPNDERMPLTTKNYILMLAGMAVIISGCGLIVGGGGLSVGGFVSQAVSVGTGLVGAGGGIGGF